MNRKVTLRLQPSEAVVVEAASRIFSAFVMSGTHTLANEKDVIERSIRIALTIAQRTDEIVRSDEEMS